MKKRWVLILVVCILLIKYKNIFAFQKMSVEFQINSYTTNRQCNPCVAKLTNGGFVVTWQSREQDGSGSGIFCQLFDSTGKKVKQEFQVNLYDLGNQRSPSVAGLLDSGFVIVWESHGRQKEAIGSGCFGQIFDDLGNRRGNRLRLFDNSIFQWGVNPSVTALRSGGFVIVWESRSDQEDLSWDIFGQVFDAMGKKVGSHFTVNSYRKDAQSSAKVSSLKDGGFIVIWISNGQNRVSISVVGQLFDAKGKKIGDDFLIFALPNNDSPDICGLDNGNFIAVCETGRNCDVYGQLFDSHGKKLGTEFKMNTNYKFVRGDPAIADLKNGKFVVIWEGINQDDTDVGIFGQVFDSNAEKKGTEFRVNSLIKNAQQSPSVTNVGDDRFIVVWQSDGQDGDDYGIFGKILKDSERQWLIF